MTGEVNRSRTLEECADEIFELTTMSWRARAASRPKGVYDLGQREYLTLDFLMRREPQSVGELQRSLGILPAQMSRVIRSLERKHGKALVACSINRADKRRVDIRLTEYGRRAHREHRVSQLGTILSILDGLTERDRQEFMRILRLIRAALARRLARPDSQK